MANIGVVVPVYKVEPYLRRCVDSILGQTYPDFSLILVDDGSPDRSGEICDWYAGKDPRVRVIHQSNGGLSAARNTAIDLLIREHTVQWITFIDSDDWVHPQMLELLFSGAREHQTAIASCGFAETTGEMPAVAKEVCSFETWSAKDFYLQHFVNATIACAKLYHISCFDGVRYPAGKLHEDEFVTYRLLFSNRKLAVTFAPLYCYYINPQGITKSGWTARRLDAWEALDQQLDYFRKLGDQDLLSSRTRDYLETALKHFAAAEQADAQGDLKKMRGRIRRLIRECWALDKIAFWADFDILIRFYPVMTRLYRLWLEITYKE